MPDGTFLPSARTMAAIVVVTLACILLPDRSSAGSAMPFTEEAVASLNRSIEKIKAPVYSEDPGENDINVKKYIATYREIFAAAGYDYERSVIRIINDIQFDRYRLNRATIKLNGLARELLRLHVKTGVNPRKYLSRDCAEMLIEFRELIRSNMTKYGGC